MADAASGAKARTLNLALRAAVQRLRAAGVEDPVLDANLLLSHATGLDRLAMLRDGERQLSGSELHRFDSMIAARAAREPVSRVLGRREFWSLEFQISRDVLDPRPDSETVVASALELLPQVDGSYRLADFGTGSGCLLLALLSERSQAWGLGIDSSTAAARQAQVNAQSLGLADRASFLVADWGEALDGSFDLIIANPPYIASSALAGLEPEVHQFDPVSALDGGADGLVAYRALFPALRRLLNPGGQAVLECGEGQVPALRQLAASTGFSQPEVRRDLSGIERCLSLSISQ